MPDLRPTCPDCHRRPIAAPFLSRSCAPCAARQIRANAHGEHSDQVDIEAHARFERLQAMRREARA